MKIMIKYTTILILYLVLLHMIHFAYCKSSNEIKNNNFTKMRLSLTNALSLNLIDSYSEEQRMGGYPTVTFDKNKFISVPDHIEGWQKYVDMKNGLKGNHFKYTNQYAQNTNSNFYFSVDNDAISVYENPLKDLKSKIDTIEMKDLDKINTTSGCFQGGLQDIGNFIEGFCYEIRGIKLNIPFKLIICTDQYDVKCSFMNSIAKCKQEYDMRCMNPQTKPSCDTKNNQGISNPPSIFPGDSSRQQPGSSHSAIKAKLRRKPKVKIIKEKLPPVIQMYPLASTRSRNERCVIKEDSLIVKGNFLKECTNSPNAPNYPSRAVLTPKWLTFYEITNSKKKLKFFLLKRISIVANVKDDDKCIEIGEYRNTLVICAPTFSKTDPKANIQQWKKDIIDFRDNCTKNQRYTSSTILSAKEMLKSPEVQNFIAQLQHRQIESQLQKYSNADERRDQSSKIEEEIKKAQLLAVRALDKELKYEQRMEIEEQMREEKENEEVRNDLLREQKRREKLQKVISVGPNVEMAHKAKDIQMRYRLQRELKQIKEQATVEIKTKRKSMEERIQRMRKIHDRQLSKARQQILEVRTSMKQNLMKAEKLGDMKLCKSRTDKEYRDEYCNKNFVADFLVNVDCKKEDEFCYICCENEFGGMHPEERAMCNIQCERK